MLETTLTGHQSRVYLDLNLLICKSLEESEDDINCLIADCTDQHKASMGRTSMKPPSAANRSGVSPSGPAWFTAAP